MTYFGLKPKGYEPLTPEEWNLLIRAIDVLYTYIADIYYRLEMK